MRVGAISFLPAASQREPSLPPIQAQIHVQIQIHTNTNKNEYKYTQIQKLMQKQIQIISFLPSSSQQESSLNPLQCLRTLITRLSLHPLPPFYFTSLSCPIFLSISCPLSLRPYYHCAHFLLFKFQLNFLPHFFVDFLPRLVKWRGPQVCFPN